MTELAVVQAAPLAESERWEGLCFGTDALETYRLPSPAEARALQAEIAASLAPIATADLRGAVKRLVGSYPQAGPADPRVYVLALSENLAGYPADIVATVCRQVVRTCRFLPTVAEVVDLAEPLYWRRKRAAARVAEVEEARQAQAEATQHERERSRGAHAARLADAVLPGGGSFLSRLATRGEVVMVLLPVIRDGEEPDLETVLDRLGMTVEELAALAERAPEPTEQAQQATA